MKLNTVTEVLTTKRKYKKQYKNNLVVNLLELILKKKTLIFLKLSTKYLNALNNKLKNSDT